MFERNPRVREVRGQLRSVEELVGIDLQIERQVELVQERESRPPCSTIHSVRERRAHKAWMGRPIQALPDAANVRVVSVRLELGCDIPVLEGGGRHDCVRDSTGCEFAVEALRLTDRIHWVVVSLNVDEPYDGVPRSVDEVVLK